MLNHPLLSDRGWCDSAWCSFIEQLSTNANRVFRGGIYGVIVYSGLIWKAIGHSASSTRALVLNLKKM